MVKGTDPTLSENTEVSSGLRQFRNIAQGRPEFDSPFGTPPKPIQKPTQVAQATPPVELAPAPEPVVELPKREAPRPERTTPKVSRERVRPKAEETQVGEASEDAFPEKVTVPLTLEMRLKAEELARLISRRRSVKDHHITRNSLIRVALQCFLDEFELPNGKPINSEAELLEAARSRRKR
ncbi:MAG: hypothetical protein HS102_11080 [Planctomycetia bacterium]|nr:hypothetical protein [Planctomycetia bacterium]